MIHKWRICLYHFFILAAVGLIFVISIPVHAAQCPTGRVSYWTLDDASGGPYLDSVGTNNGAAAASGAPDATTSGKVSGAQLFTAANTDGIDVPSNAAFDFGVNDSFSIEFWMKGNAATATDATPEVMVGRDNAGNTPQWWVGVTASKNIRWYIKDSDGVAVGINASNASPAIDASDGLWHHIVCVRDVDTHKLHLYVDNVDTETDDAFTAGFTSTLALNMGYLNNDYYFNGTLDEVVIYNRALAATEVQEHFNGTGGPRYCMDSDSDGITDGEENAGPNNGDGNSDGIPDLSQDTVGTLLTKSGTDYVTLVTSAGTLANCQAVDNPSAGDVPVGLNFPVGFFSFTINGPASATVTMHTPSGTAPDAYYKYGPPTPGEADAWYAFTDDGTTGASFSSNIVTLKFVDGERGDDTVADGSIVDQGGPAIKTSAFDSDGDGISDGEEDGAPNSGDGNLDGILDKNQNTVVSLLTKSGTDYVTIETSAGTLANCQAVDNPSPGDAPSDKNFPWGFFNFTINGLNPADPATITFRTPAGSAPDTYYKYGPPTPGEADAWYEFTDDSATATGATINSNVITLKFVDGQRGDDTGEDGSIVDQGGPATQVSTPATVNGGGGSSGCFIATAAYGSFMEPHVKLLRKFRDRFLLENSIGKAFVNLYYKYSPPMADFISNHAISKELVRISLLPIVGMSWVTLKLGLLPAIALMFFCSFGFIGITIFRRKKVKH